jgi:hypothetical protein
VASGLGMYFSTSGYFVTTEGDAGDWTYTIHSISNGELKEVARLGHMDYSTHNFNGTNITEAQYNAYLRQYGLENMNTKDQKEDILKMTAAPSGPDAWAQAEVAAAQALGLVPASIESGGWQSGTSRLAAADAIVLLIEKASGKTMAQIASEKGWSLTNGGFTDTSSQAVTFLKHAGITSGIGNNQYGPDRTYTRAEFVTMVGRAAENIFDITAQGSNPFTDDVPSWAAPYVGYAAANSITGGVGGNRFDPNGTLQNQQTAMFSLRTFNAWK